MLQTIAVKWFALRFWSIIESIRQWCRYAALITFQAMMEPRNKDIADYCAKSVGAKFVGETSNKVDNTTDIAQETNLVNLGSVLRSMHYEMQKAEDKFTGEEESFAELFEQAIKLRQPDDVDPRQFRTKMLRDKQKFIQLYKQRLECPDKLGDNHQFYWGTRQQLRSGKVVADWIDKDYGPLDPIFGALLLPTGGRTGPGDACIIHRLFFDNSGMIAYHSAVHDAFGYLLRSHGIGPGYKYLEAASIFGKYNPLSQQLAGVVFWYKVSCKRNDCEDRAHIC